MKRKLFRVRGSYTVEAVFLFPIIVFLLAFMLQMFADWKKALFVCALYAFNREMISNVTINLQ